MSFKQNTDSLGLVRATALAFDVLAGDLVFLDQFSQGVVGFAAAAFFGPVFIDLGSRTIRIGFDECQNGFIA